MTNHNDSIDEFVNHDRVDDFDDRIQRVVEAERRRARRVILDNIKSAFGCDDDLAEHILDEILNPGLDLAPVERARRLAAALPAHFGTTAEAT